MNVFKLRDRLVSDYGTYVRSFINIKDERIDAQVQNDLDEGLLWPDPLIQLPELVRAVYRQDRVGPLRPLTPVNMPTRQGARKT
jgi:hypothetical protein